jgi:peptide/nickel transport system substrate-binding protein
MRTWKTKIALVAGLVILVSGCGSSGASTPPAVTPTGVTPTGVTPTGVTPTAVTPQAGGTITVAQLEDADVLDPSLTGTIGAREVLFNMCLRLYDLDTKGAIVPQLAAEPVAFSADGMTATIKLRTGLKFNDGTAFDAQAVKTTLERDQTITGSRRAFELSVITSIDAPDAQTVVLHLKNPKASLVASFVNAAGMIMSPAQLTKLGDKFGDNPICVGPFKFLERVPGDHTTIVKSEFWVDAANVYLDKIIFKPIPDESVRAANLEAGSFQAIDRVGVTDMARLQGNAKLKLETVPSNAFQTLVLNIQNANGNDKPPAVPNRVLAKNPSLREAFELGLDRDQINQVIFQGFEIPNCIAIAPSNPFYTDPNCPKRDVTKAKALVAASGIATPIPVTIFVPNNPTLVRMVELIQSQEKEVGFDVTVTPGEVVAVATQAAQGNFDILVDEFSGRADPDLNLTNYQGTGGSDNYSNASDPAIDAALQAARVESDFAKRKALYAQAIPLIMARRALIYLYSEKLVAGHSVKLIGFDERPDGYIRYEHMSLQP